MYLELYLDLTLDMVILHFMVNSICQRVKVAGYFGFEFGSSFSKFTLDSSHNSDLRVLFYIKISLHVGVGGMPLEKEENICALS